MSERRELDSITPDFSLTPEQVSDLKRILVNEEYAKEIREKHELYRKKHYMELKKLILSGVGDNGITIPVSILEELKKRYKSGTGVDLDENKL